MTTEFYDWEEIRAELFDGDEEALAAERARTEAWVNAFRVGAAKPVRADQGGRETIRPQETDIRIVRSGTKTDTRAGSTTNPE